MICIGIGLQMRPGHLSVSGQPPRTGNCTLIFLAAGGRGGGLKVEVIRGGANGLLYVSGNTYPVRERAKNGVYVVRVRPEA